MKIFPQYDFIIYVKIWITTFSDLQNMLLLSLVYMSLYALEFNLKLEGETIKKSQRKIIFQVESLVKKSEVVYESIINRIQKIEERISSAEDTIGTPCCNCHFHW